MAPSTVSAPAAGSAVFSVEPTPQFARCLEKLRARSGRPAAAAAKGDRVLSALASGRAAALREAGALTAWGERRVVGCGKFNLGGGYRLIYSRRGGTVVPRFAGNHEECHRWLTANRGLDLRPERRPSTANGGIFGNERDEPQESRQFPDYPEIALSDRELRRVFAGLCGAVAKPAAPVDEVARPPRDAGRRLPSMHGNCEVGYEEA